MGIGSMEEKIVVRPLEPKRLAHIMKKSEQLVKDRHLFKKARLFEDALKYAGDDHAHSRATVMEALGETYGQLRRHADAANMYSSALSIKMSPASTTGDASESVRSASRTRDVDGLSTELVLLRASLATQLYSSGNFDDA